MAYISFNEDSQHLGSLGCGGQCRCGPCAQRHSGRASLAEWYERDEPEPRPLAPASNNNSPARSRLGQAPVAVAQAASTTSGFEVDGPATPSLRCIQGQQLKGRQVTFIVRYLRDLTRPEARAV